MWLDFLVGCLENYMIGVFFMRGGYVWLCNLFCGSGGYMVWWLEYWVFEGLDLIFGDIIGINLLVIGYECDGCELMIIDGWLVVMGMDEMLFYFEVLGMVLVYLWEMCEGDFGMLNIYVGELNWVV